jgi:iron-sulfur cluster assembly accessory protein
MILNISQKAKTKLVELISKNGKSAFLYIKGGGCHGFSYNFKILDTNLKPNKLDEEFKLDEHKLFLCNKSLIYLIGLRIDYIDDVMGSRFDFSNDNIQSKCGCGTSFAFKEVI